MVSKRIKFGLFFFLFFFVAHLSNLKVRFENNSNLPHVFFKKNSNILKITFLFFNFFTLRFRRGENGPPSSCLLINNRARLICLEANN